MVTCSDQTRTGAKINKICSLCSGILQSGVGAKVKVHVSP